MEKSYQIYQVKNDIKHLGIYSLIAIYCLAVSFVTNSYFKDAQTTKSSLSREKFLSNLTAEFFHHTPQPENTLNNKYNLPTPVAKKNLLDSLGNIFIISHLFEIRGKQYIKLLPHITGNKKISAFLFPFHYFW
jgi:hypothetical protein